MSTDMSGTDNDWSSRSARNLARRSRFLSPDRGSDPACHALSFVSDRTMIVRILSRSACNQTEHVAPKAGIQVFLEFSWIRALACTRPLGRTYTAFGVTRCGTKPTTPCFRLPSGQREQRSSEIFSAASDAYYAFAIAKT